MAGPQGPWSQGCREGTLTVPLLLFQLVASGPVGHKGLCHLGEDEPLLSLFPLRLIQRVCKRSGDSWRNREKGSRGYC